MKFPIKTLLKIPQACRCNTLWNINVQNSKFALLAVNTMADHARTHWRECASQEDEAEDPLQISRSTRQIPHSLLSYATFVWRRSHWSNPSCSIAFIWSKWSLSYVIFTWLTDNLFTLVQLKIHRIFCDNRHVEFCYKGLIFFKIYENWNPLLWRASVIKVAKC